MLYLDPFTFRVRLYVTHSRSSIILLAFMLVIVDSVNSIHLNQVKKGKVFYSRL